MVLRVFGWILRLVLGGLFIYAAATKGLYPFQEPFLFAMAVSSYRLLPEWAVIGVSRTLPWLEIVLGVLLVVGWRLRWLATFAAVLLGVFITAMGVTYARGIEADCGCFGLGEPISPMTLLRDSGILAIAVFLAVQSWRGQSRPASPSR